MPHTKKVFDAIDKSIDTLVGLAMHPESLLYVGWRHDCNPWWYDKFCPAMGIKRIGVLEIFENNLHDLDQLVWSGRYDVATFLGDVRKIEKHVNDLEYDVIFWDHGPEHVSIDELIVTTDKLKKAAGKCLMYCCPWGEWPQEIEDGNVNEIHRTSITPEILKGLGFVVQEFGQPGVKNDGELFGIAVRTKHS